MIFLNRRTMNVKKMMMQMFKQKDLKSKKIILKRVLKNNLIKINKIKINVIQITIFKGLIRRIKKKTKKMNKHKSFIIILIKLKKKLMMKFIKFQNTIMKRKIKKNSFIVNY